MHFFYCITIQASKIFLISFLYFALFYCNPMNVAKNHMKNFNKNRHFFPSLFLKSFILYSYIFLQNNLEISLKVFFPFLPIIDILWPKNNSLNLQNNIFYKVCPPSFFLALRTPFLSSFLHSLPWIHNFQNNKFF